MVKVFEQGGAMRLLVLSFVFLLSACHGGWKQDPFDGQSDRIKNAITPTTVVKKLPPPKQGALYVDMPDVYSVTEGETLKIPVKYHIVHKEVQLSSIEVKGLIDKFPGATLDTTKGQESITLRPDYNFVPADLPYKVEKLTVSFFNEYGGQIEETTRSIAIMVIPENETIPLIEDVVYDDGSDKIIAGETKGLTVYVRDTNHNYSPRLQVMDQSDTDIMVAQFFSVKGEGTYDATTGLWAIKAEINVPSRFYAARKTIYAGPDIYAYSVSGIPSRAETIRMRVFSKAIPPLVAAENPIRFIVDQPTDYTFSIYDPYDRSDNISGSCLKMPQGMTCNCRQGQKNNRDIFMCTVSWTPTQTGFYELEVKGVASIIGAVMSSAETKETLTIRVTK